MPDISMCVNNKCPVRAYCYRYRATPGGMQSYTRFEPRSYDNIGTLTDQCEYAWSIKGHEHRIRPTADVDKLFESQEQNND